MSTQSRHVVSNVISILNASVQFGNKLDSYSK